MENERLDFSDGSYGEVVGEISMAEKFSPHPLRFAIFYSKLRLHRVGPIRAGAWQVIISNPTCSGRVMSCIPRCAG
jgi:hypothetical protein